MSIFAKWFRLLHRRCINVCARQKKKKQITEWKKPKYLMHMTTSRELRQTPNLLIKYSKALNEWVHRCEMDNENSAKPKNPAIRVNINMKTLLRQAYFSSRTKFLLNNNTTTQPARRCIEKPNEFDNYVKMFVITISKQFGPPFLPWPVNNGVIHIIIRQT